MSISVLRNFVKETLTEAYSSGLIKTLTDKFKKENSTLTDQVIEYYIDLFDKNKDGSKIKGAGKSNDILQYSWSELEKLIDANFSTHALYEPVIADNMKPVYQSEDGSLQIFLGDRKEKCITIRQNFEKRTGERYTWCISRSDSSNMFTVYRFRMKEPVFYFVFDTERQKSDPYHAVVIYPNANGEFYLATSENSGDTRTSWEEITSLMPKLKDLKPVFKHIPLTEKEKQVYEAVKNKLDDESFDNLSRDLKEEYIAFGHELSQKQVRSAFISDKSLVNKYCNMHRRVLVPLDIYKKLPPATKKVIEGGFLEKKELYELYYLGKTKIEGNLVFSGINAITSLPQGLEVSGDLILSRSSIVLLPEGLKVDNNLILKDSLVTTLPKNLRVGGHVVASGSKITTLAGGIKIGSDLDLADTQITSIPEDLEVVGNLNLEGTQITSIPQGIKIGKDLVLAKTPITSLPQGLEVKGMLLLTFSKITSLPQGLKVGGSLYANNTKIDSLPQGLKVDGSLLLYNTQITSLPRGLEVGKNLNVSQTPIADLPSDLKVGASLHISDTLITSLPRGLKVNKNLVLEHTQISSLPEGLWVGGHVYLEDAPIASLPKDIYIGGVIFGNEELFAQYEKIKKSKSKLESVLRAYVKSVLV